MYHGRTLGGLPTAIAEDKLTWAFFENEPAAQSNTELMSRHIADSDVTLYPFAHGELYALLGAAGFRDIDVYGDLRPVGGSTSDEKATMPSAEALGESTFITYVAHRPQ